MEYLYEQGLPFVEPGITKNRDVLTETGLGMIRSTSKRPRFFERSIGGDIGARPNIPFEKWDTKVNQLFSEQGSTVDGLTKDEFNKKLAAYIVSLKLNQDSLQYLLHDVNFIDIWSASTPR